MEQLLQMKCVACRADSPRVTEAEMAEYRPQVPEWQIVERDGIPRLERTFRFGDFLEAVDFTNRVAELAEAEGHHPVIELTWGRVTVTWWTHKIKWLHRNDFVAAAKTDKLYQAAG